MVKGAWVTLATNDSYSLGALVLAHSLKQVGTQQELAVLVTPGVTNSMRARLSEVFNIVREVNVLDSKDTANLRLLQRPELGITFTKLHCWQLTVYEKCVFLDADTLVLQNCDELFEREELSAAPDVGWPDCFNSGVFVYRPSEETYNSLIQFALDKGSFDGGDQGLLNLYFSDWARKDISKHLPFIYNVCSTAFYSYLPAFKQFGKDVKIIHFIGNAKPWLQYFDTETKKVRPSRDLGHLEPILQRWWNIFCSMIHPNLSADMISSYPSDHVSASTPEQSPQKPYNSPPSPIENTNYVRPNVYDPWEEYDRKQKSVAIHSPEHLESHNTTALCSVAPDHSCIDHSNPIIDIPSVDRHDQHNTDSSTSVEYSHDCQSGIEICSEPNLIEEVFLGNSSSPSNTHEEIDSHVNFETIQESLSTFPVPSHPKEIATTCEVSISNDNPSNLSQTFHEYTPHETENVIPEEKHSIVCHSPEETPSDISYIPEKIPTTHIPNNHETEEDSNNVPCEMEIHVEDSGLAGAFAKLTLGHKRTPEQEALEDSLRRQNWEQGNIDYLGKDSFDNIWSKICETLAKVPQENEGSDSTQIKSDDSEISSPQQETYLPSKEDVLPAPQESPLIADSSSLTPNQDKPSSDPISSLPPEAVSSEITPDEGSNTEKQASPKPDPSQEKPPSESVPSSCIETKESSESKKVPIAQVSPPKEIPKHVDGVQSVKLPSEKESSVSVGQTPSDSLPPAELASKPEIFPSPPTQTLCEGVPVPKSQSVPVPAKQVDREEHMSGSVAEIPISPENIPEKVLPESQTVPPTQQAPLTEQVVSPPQTPLAQQAASSPQAPQMERAVSLPQPVSSEGPVCPLKEATPVEEAPALKLTPSSPAPLSEKVIQQEISVSPKVPSMEQTLVSVEPSCALPKAVTPTESSKSSQEKASPIPLQAPSKPEQISPEKALQPSSPTEPLKEVPSQSEQVPSDTQIPPLKDVPLSPTQIAPSKQEEVPSKEPKQQPSQIEEVPPFPASDAPIKVATPPERHSTPVSSSPQVSIPAPADPVVSQPSNTATASPVVSAEPPPPIAPPPRKSGGNKKQSKPKK